MDRNPSLDGKARELALKLTPALEERAGQLISYSELMAQYGLTTEDPAHRSLFAHALAHVSRKSWNKNRFMLSACVVKKDSNQPGNGFYELAVDLEALEPNSSNEIKEALWIEQMKKISKKYGKG